MQQRMKITIGVGRTINVFVTKCLSNHTKRSKLMHQVGEKAHAYSAYKRRPTQRKGDFNIVLILVLKSARRTEANRVPRHKAQEARRRRTHHGCEAHFYAKFFKDLSHSTKHILHKQVR